MRFGCCVSPDKIGIVQDAGYDYVELQIGVIKPEAPDSEFEAVREQIQSYDIVPEAWCCLLGSEMKVTGPEVDMYRIERYLRTAFERVEELGGEVIVFGSGGARKIPDDFPADEAREQLVEFLTLAGQVAGAYGITIAIEPLNSRETNVITSVTEAAELARRVDHPFVKVLADLYQMTMDGEPASSVITAGNELVHTHIADTDRSYPGSGKYPSREFFEALRSIGYNDRMSAECGWPNFDTDCIKALEFLRSLDNEIPF